MHEEFLNYKRRKTDQHSDLLSKMIRLWVSGTFWLFVLVTITIAIVYVVK